MKNLKTGLFGFTIIVSLLSLSALLSAFTPEVDPGATAENIHEPNCSEACASYEAEASYLKEARKNFLGTWQQAKEYTLEIAEIMPADKYAYKPYEVDSVRTFAQQLKHLAYINYGINSIFMKDEAPTPPPADFEETGLSKKEIIAFLNTSFDEVSATIEGMSEKELSEKREMMFFPNKPEFSRLQYLDFIVDHTTHHRAQLLVYLRSNDITPPTYRFFPVD